jgi:hypothetical protein
VHCTWLTFVAIIASHDLWIMRPQRRHARRALRLAVDLKHTPATQREQADPDHHPEPHQQHRPRPVRRHPGHNDLRHSETSKTKQRPGPQDHRPAPPAHHNDLIEKRDRPPTPSRLGRSPTLSICSAEHRRNRRKQKGNKLTHPETRALLYIVEKVSRRASGVTDEETARRRHYTRGDAAPTLPSGSPQAILAAAGGCL